MGPGVQAVGAPSAVVRKHDLIHGSPAGGVQHGLCDRAQSGEGAGAGSGNRQAGGARTFAQCFGSALISY